MAHIRKAHRESPSLSPSNGIQHIEEVGNSIGGIMDRSGGRYDFHRWKKTELRDLINKLDIPNVKANSTKTELVDSLEAYLYSLPKKLETELEYPELRSFYSSLDGAKREDDSRTMPGTRSSRSTEHHVTRLSMNLGEVTEDGNDAEVGEDEEAGNKAYSHISISTRDEEKERQFGRTTLRNRKSGREHVSTLDAEEVEELNSPNAGNLMMRGYNDEENTTLRSMIGDGVRHLNRNIQDFMSSLATISVIFCLIEFLIIVQHWFQFGSDYRLVHLLLAWLVVYILTPLLASYYINFVRWDLGIEIDPMIFFIVKGLLSYAFIVLHPTQFANARDFFTQAFAPNSNVFERLIEEATSKQDIVLDHMHSVAGIIGQTPLVFSIVGVVLTLYVI